MNLWWIAGLAVFVALEKVSAPHIRVSMVFGFALIVTGILVASGNFSN